jgi:WD40 repeat protein/serine/threonine protein kinase
LASGGANDQPTCIIEPLKSDRAQLHMDGSWPQLPGYDILSLIGRGGMGLIYKARQRNLNRIVAVKTLHFTALADDETRKRFQSEAEAVARLQHPNIVQIFEVGSADVQEIGGLNPFIALEFVDGGSLVQQIGYPQTPTKAAQLVVKLARAVAAAHRYGIVHRDLKPANVLMTREGEPKIADFGLAKQLDSERDASGRSVTQAGAIVGTPEYMSPEQAAGVPATTAVDIYALGVILYELLTARVPFQAATPTETMELVRHQEPVPPRQLRPGIPRDLDTICLKCLEKEPDCRYVSAEALADELQRFLDERPIQARRVNSFGRARRWWRRNPVAAASLSGVVSMFITAFIAVTCSYWRAETAGKQAAQRAQAERLESYYGNLAATANAFHVFNVASARRTLETATEEHRNWEWRYFQSRLDLTAHVSEPVDPKAGSVQFSPSGRLAVRWRANDQLSLWDTARRTEIGLISSPISFALCRDEQAVAVVQPDHSVSVIEVATGKTHAVLRDQTQPIIWLAASGDGKRIVTITSDRQIGIWDASDGRLQRKFATRTDIQMGVRVSPDGRWVAGDQDGGVHVAVWDAETGNQVSLLGAHKCFVRGTFFNTAGNRIVTIEAFPANIVRLWEPSSGRLIATLTGHRNTVGGCEFSPDDAYFATCSVDQTIRLWNGENGQFVAALKGHLGPVNSLAFRADGKRIVSASNDHSVRIWDVPTGDLLTVLPGHSHEVSSVRYLPDGGVVSAAQDGAIRLWDPRTAEGDGVIRGHSSYVYDAIFHPDGKRIASASWDGTARIWDATSGMQLAVLPHGDKAIVTGVAFHPGGKILASRSRDAVRLWDVESGRELHRWTIASGGWKDTRLAFSPDGTLLATGCTNFEVRLWDVASREEVAILRGQTDEIRDVVFSPDGRYLAVATDGGDRKVHIWDVARRRLVCALEGHKAGCYGAAFSRDGSLLASASTDATVRLWSTKTWQEVAVLTHDVLVYGVAFSADGSRLVSACADSSLRFWDMNTYREVAELRGDNKYYHQVDFSPDGSRLVSACGDGAVRVWDTLRAADRAVQDAKR